MSGAEDWNICPHCDEFYALDADACEDCGQPLVLKAKGAISVWRLGEFEDGVLGPILAGIAKAFGRRVVLQPSYLRAELSDREDRGWRGRSGGVFLDQVNARHELSGTPFLSFGITEENIVPDGNYNFVFGLGYEGAAVISLAPLRDDNPEAELLTERAVQIAVHELGHGLGLDHHTYEEGVACVMVGDEEEDCLETVDQCRAEFCGSCREGASINVA